MAKLQIDVTTNGITKAEKEIKSLDKEVNKLSKSTDSNVSSNNKLGLSMGKLTGTVAGAITAISALNLAYEKILKNGIQYQSLIENQLTGLTASPNNPPGLERKSKITLFIPSSFKLSKAFFTSDEAFSLNLVKTI